MPSTILSDNGASSGTAGIKTTGSNDGALQLQTTTAGGTATAAMTIDTSQNVGIGTASPGQKLHVAGNTGSTIVSVGDSTLTEPYVYLAADASGNIGNLYTRSNHPMAFGTNNDERMRIDTSGNVGIGTSSPPSYGAGFTVFQVNGSSSGIVQANNSTNSITTEIESESTRGSVGTRTNHPLAFKTNQTERMRIDSSGNLLVGKTSSSFNTVGSEITPSGIGAFTRSQDAPLIVNRITDDGKLASLRQDGTEEGNISVSGTTVSYNGGHLSRWAQTTAPKDDTLVKGTVLANLDEMNVYTDADGNPVDNEQLNKVKVSDVEGDIDVAGVFVNWSYDEQHQVDEINMAMTGDMIIRIAQGVTVARGDLMMSAGDGTAKPQGDDIVRSKTIAKVTSTHVTCTYEDGSYCVPCVLMAC